MLCFQRLLSIISRILKKVTSPSFDIWSKWSKGLATGKTSAAASGKQEKVPEKHKAVTKMKLNLTVQPLQWSPDSTTSELRNVLINVDHVKHTW